MNKMPKSKPPASSFSKFLLIPASLFLFGLFLKLLSTQSYVLFDQQLLASDGLLSKSKPPLAKNSSYTFPTSFPSTEPAFSRLSSLIGWNTQLLDATNEFVTTPPVSSTQRTLCRILNNRLCRSYFIAGNADLVWAIAPIYNFNTFGDQEYYFNLHRLFHSYIKSYGFNHISIEAIRFPNETRNPISNEASEYSVTRPDNEPYDIQVYYYNVSYIRENLLNVAIRKLDKLAPWDYVMWIDAHHFFENPYWWEEGIYKIERSGAVQLFDGLEALNFYNISNLHFESAIRMSLFTNSLEGSDIVYGNAYIITKDIYNQIGYVYDECIATSCDCAYILASFPDGVGWSPIAPNYYKTFEPWISNAKKAFKGRRSYVRGLIKHFAHGRSFPYEGLQAMIDAADFDPQRDIGRDSNFSLYIKNDYLSSTMEEIILDFKNLPW